MLLYAPVGSRGARIKAGATTPAGTWWGSMLKNNPIIKLQNSKNPGQLYLPVGYINRELISVRNHRFVIVRSVSGEKPKRMSRSDRRTVVCPICARSEEWRDEAIGRRGNGVCGCKSQSFSGLRAGNRQHRSMMPSKLPASRSQVGQFIQISV
jgi:hypothetical protein